MTNEDCNVELDYETTVVSDGMICVKSELDYYMDPPAHYNGQVFGTGGICNVSNSPPLKTSNSSQCGVTTTGTC